MTQASCEHPRGRLLPVEGRASWWRCGVCEREEFVAPGHLARWLRERPTTVGFEVG